VGHEPFKTFKDVPSEPKESIVNKSGTGDQGPSIFQCCLHKPLAGCVNRSLVELLRPISYSCFSNMGPNYASVKFVRTVRFSDHCPPSHSSKIICLGMSGDRSQLSLNFACFFLGMWHIFHPPIGGLALMRGSALEGRRAFDSIHDVGLCRGWRERGNRRSGEGVAAGSHQQQ
jgi:hypothetical protein